MMLYKLKYPNADSDGWGAKPRQADFFPPYHRHSTDANNAPYAGIVRRHCHILSGSEKPRLSEDHLLTSSPPPASIAIDMSVHWIVIINRTTNQVKTNHSAGPPIV